MLGYDPGTFQETRDSWLSRIHPEDQAMAMGMLADYMQGRSPRFRVECRMQTRWGDWKWVLCLGRIQKWSPDGQPLRMLGTHTDISEQKQAVERIHHLAFYDPVTRLPNRRLMLDRLRQNLVNSVRYGRQGALMLLDLDHFKDFNVTLGHAAGDRLLQDVAGRLVACVGEGDTVARLGGDEFVILIGEVEPDTGTTHGIETLALRLLSSLRNPFDYPSQDGAEPMHRDHHVSASMGVVLFKDQRLSAEELLKRADTAMYAAKAAGGGVVRFFDPRMQTQLTERITLERDLRGAIDNGQLQALYQPQVDAADRVVGAELLLRWHHPTRGLIAPGQFIRLAEECGLILPIGEWVLDQAFARLARWSSSPRFARLSLAVNVSALQFGLSGLVRQLLTRAHQTGAPLTRLKLELTESLLLKDIEPSIARMKELRNHGIGMALDDFGTGYSSLTYLKRLPLDQIKIDQSFVRDIPTNPSDAAIIRAIITLTQNLGISVIAEGVETPEQRDALHEIGCSMYQGYLYGKALPAEEFENLPLEFGSLSGVAAN